MKLTDSQYARAYKKEIETVVTVEEASRIWKAAENHYRQLLSKNAQVPKEVAVIFSLGVKTTFGEKAGFSYRFISDTSRDLEFDMLKCPYTDYCKKYGCEELTHIFCKNDEYAYGNLPGINFIRTETIGTGGSCCDFKFKRS